MSSPLGRDCCENIVASLRPHEQLGGTIKFWVDVPRCGVIVRLDIDGAEALTADGFEHERKLNASRTGLCVMSELAFCSTDE